MSRGPITLCPICNDDVGINAKTQEEASQTLAQHIFAQHTKRRKGGQAVLEIPVEKATHLTRYEKRDIQIFGHLNPSRKERRAYAKQCRGNSQGRAAR